MANEFMEKLKKYLLSFPDAELVSGGNEVVMRCRFCGDSQSDLGAKHLYIKVTGDLPFYKCQKCPAKGILDDKVIPLLNPQYGDDDIEVMEQTRQYLYDASKRLKGSKRNNRFNILNRYCSDTELNMKKLKYINYRLGTNMSVAEELSNNIVLSLWDLLDGNHIEKYTRYPNDISILSDYGVGFLSMDRGMVVIKNLADEGTLNKYLDHRYNVYKIFDGSEASQSYIIPTSIDMTSRVPVNIHIAEGVFDALSICYNLCNGAKEQNIYMAVCGKAYFDALCNLIKKTRVMNFILNLYPDNDVPDTYPDIRNLIGLSKDMGFKMFIHRNSYPGEKDMGVSKDKIKVFTVSI